MIGIEDFLKIFGNFTITDLVCLILAAYFIVKIYNQVKNFAVKKIKEKEESKTQLNEALEAIQKFPEYRKKSVEIQQVLENEIQELRKAQDDNTRRLMEMEDGIKGRERNKLRDSLLQNYRYYTSKDHNPLQAWTKMESEAFWELFNDYEAINGNGYMHTVVQPAMHELIVIDMEDADGISNLMQHRN